MGLENNSWHFADDNVFTSEIVCIWIKFSLQFVGNGSIANKLALDQVMAWLWTRSGPLPECAMT